MKPFKIGNALVLTKSANLNANDRLRIVIDLGDQDPPTKQLLICAESSCFGLPHVLRLYEDTVVDDRDDSEYGRNRNRRFFDDVGPIQEPAQGDDPFVFITSGLVITMPGVLLFEKHAPTSGVVSTGEWLLTHAADDEADSSRYYMLELVNAGPMSGNFTIEVNYSFIV